MTIKKIALALFTVPAMANTQQCAPEAWAATESNFSLELAAGGCTMNGPVQSNTETPHNPKINFQEFGLGLQNASNSNTLQLDLYMDMLRGYQANWNRMTPLPSQMGFAGQINMHWNYVCNGMGAGLYAGVGYNASRASSTIPTTFKNSVVNPVVRFLPQGTNGVVENINLNSIMTLDKVTTKPGNLTLNPRIPMGKATISSGLMFQAGTRLGAMVGNVFPHVRLGWAIYQFKAHMTNQHKPWTNALPSQAKSTNTSFRAYLQNGNIYFYGNGQADECELGVSQYANSKEFSKAYNVNAPIKISSKSQWTNAVTVGAGVDWAFNRMTLGFLYQVGICQKLTFKKWNGDVTPGLTNVDVNLIPSNTTQTYLTTGYKSTGGNIAMVHGKVTPEVSIKPVMHTAMLSVKYVLGKAA